MEDIEFCKADFLYMLNELNKYAIENEVDDVWLMNNTVTKSIDFTHFNKSYENGNTSIYIYSWYNINTAYEKFERMMKCMKEGALLVD